MIKDDGRSPTPNYSSRRACIQRVRDFLKVWDQCAAQGMIVSTGAATVLWTEDLREVLATIDVAQELLNRAKERGELMDVPEFAIQSETRECAWVKDTDCYKTGCDSYLAYDAPIDECGVNFCQNCGGKVREVK